MKYVLLALVFFLINAQAAYIDLRQGTVIAQARCKDNNKTFICVGVNFENKIYVVILDQKGEHSIYLLTEDGPILIWSRDAV